MCYFENSLIFLDYATLNLLLSIRCKYAFIVLSTAVERLPIAPICVPYPLQIQCVLHLLPGLNHLRIEIVLDLQRSDAWNIRLYTPHSPIMEIGERGGRGMQD